VRGAWSSLLFAVAEEGSNGTKRPTPGANDPTLLGLGGSKSSRVATTRASLSSTPRSEAYDTIAQLVDPEIVLNRLKAKYGAELETPEYHLGDEVPHERQLAHQFASIHAHVRPAAVTPQDSGSAGSEAS
jgi:hypothetical protein